MWLSEKDERTLLAFYYTKGGCCLCNQADLPIQQSKFDRIHISLRSRGLLNFEINPGGFAGIKVDLTPEGMGLGQKYNSSWVVWSGLWFAEYKDHWFWLIISFLGGIIGALTVNWLSK
jgi:hypothetical protein